MSHLALPAPGCSPATRALPVGVAYALVAIVASTVLLVSAWYLWHLALLVHMPAWLAWTLPVALDAGAAGATACWVGAQGAARAWGRGLALAALAATVMGNALSHLIDSGLIAVTPALVIAIGAVYPAMLWAMVHLALVLRAEHSAPVAGPFAECLTLPSVIDQPPGADASAPRPGLPAAEASGDASAPVPLRRRRSALADRHRWIEARLDAGHAVTGGQVERRFGSRNGAREVRQVMARRQVAMAGVSSS